MDTYLKQWEFSKDEHLHEAMDVSKLDTYLTRWEIRKKDNY